MIKSPKVVTQQYQHPVSNLLVQCLALGLSCYVIMYIRVYGSLFSSY